MRFFIFYPDRSHEDSLQGMRLGRRLTYRYEIMNISKILNQRRWHDPGSVLVAGKRSDDSDDSLQLVGMLMQLFSSVSMDKYYRMVVRKHVRGLLTGNNVFHLVELDYQPSTVRPLKPDV